MNRYQYLIALCLLATSCNTPRPKEAKQASTEAQKPKRPVSYTREIQGAQDIIISPDSMFVVEYINAYLHGDDPTIPTPSYYVSFSSHDVTTQYFVNKTLTERIFFYGYNKITINTTGNARPVIVTLTGYMQHR